VTDVVRVARSAAAHERTSDMAELRTCIGSTRFGIEAHEAPVEDFPIQPSQKDGLGRMCRPHWNQYTAGLARDRKARKEASAGEATSELVETTPEPVQTKPRRTRGKAAAQVAGSTEAVAE
jgi:hypothetical protein